jgi:hypothetical protein
MLEVSLDAPQPKWLDASELTTPLLPIPGFKVLVRPIEPAMRLAARDAAVAARQNKIRELGLVLAEDDAEAIALLREHPEIGAAGEVEFTTFLAVAGIVEWEGICGADKQPLPVSEKSVRAAMRNQAVYDFIDLKYVSPVLTREAEKNASSPSRSTTSKRAKTTAKRANARGVSAARTALTS